MKGWKCMDLKIFIASSLTQGILSSKHSVLDVEIDHSNKVSLCTFVPGTFHQTQ